MKTKKNTLFILGLIGVILFLGFRYSVEIGICPSVETYSDGSGYCNTTRGWGNYMWPILNFSFSVLAIGTINLIKPVANRQLLIFTAMSAVITIVAVMSAPSINGSFLSPFDKKFVGQICAVVYLLISLILIITKSVQLRKKGA